jgi:FAD:protein FMN transferase
VIIIHNLYVFGTIVNLDFDHNISAEQEILKLLYDLDDLCSTYKDNSDISKINASNDYIKVDNKVYNIIKASFKYSKITNGYEDITVKPLIDAINKKQNISNILPFVDYQKVLLKEPNLVKLKDKGMAIDLGSMVKGCACDEIVAILNKYKIENALIDLGGNIYVKGLNNNNLWRVGIQNPFKKDKIPLGYLDLTNKSIVTSGTNERGYHIINPKTGEKAHEIKSITIIADKSIDAEGLSTGCFIMGINSLNLLNNIKNLSAIIVDNKKKIYLTNNIKDKFILINKWFKVKEIH